MTTGVDDLLAYLKDKDRVAMQDVASVLSVPIETIQAWVDFLVEEKILGIEYKFTKPFIYLNHEEEKPSRAKILKEGISIELLREEFVQRAQAKQIPPQKIPDLWRSHVQEGLERKRDFFMDKARQKHLSNTEMLWKQYQQQLLLRC